MQKAILFILPSLVLGAFIGYAVPRPQAPAQPTPAPAAVSHESMGHGSMQGSMDTMTAGLQGKTGDEFDKAFIDEMIVHHQGAIDMANMVLHASTRPELRKLAEDIITAQTNEIGMMATWRAEWYK